MGTTISFIAASLVLLITPGPTNTLLATAGATVGVRKAVPLLAGEVTGYLIAISILIGLVGPIMAGEPLLRNALHVVAGAYLAASAVRLWNTPPAALHAAGPITLRRVTVTTLLNPKAMIFAFTLVPGGDTGNVWAALPTLAVLAAIIPPIGACWIALGAVVSRGLSLGDSRRGIQRVSALVLGAFACIITASVIP
jgi:threonine/homoserine/homoserine lactone efflux protein